MKRSGIADLPLHSGSVPRWLIKRMAKLADSIVYIIIEEYGPKEFLKRISDPFWFQAFGCVLGFDWHSSGLTTVVTGVLRSGISAEKHGIAIVGGKGSLSIKTPEMIEEIGEKLNFSTKLIESLKYSSKLAAKVDNAVLQDGYSLYHHVMIISEKGDWAIVQQGMNVEDRTARRYHWLSEGLRSFVVEPHSGIVGNKVRDVVLNMTHKKSEEARRVSVDLVKEGPKKVMKDFKEIVKGPLDRWISSRRVRGVDYLMMPRRINWNAIKKAYDVQPKDYEELISIRGIGPTVVRALALIAKLIYGAPVSWKDPIKYTFAHGGKDGVPYPIDVATYDTTIKTLEEWIKKADISMHEKYHALKRLNKLKIWNF